MTHILVVDDDDQVRTLLRNRFEKDGFEVSEACDALELRTSLEARTVDLDVPVSASPGRPCSSVPLA